MAGMRAGLIHPHAFLFIESEKFWSSLTTLNEAKVENLVNYEPTRFIKAVVQLVHRLTAWGVLFLTIVVFAKAKKSNFWLALKAPSFTLLAFILLQVLIGILTVINSVWKIPVFWGAVHQAGAFLLLASVLFLINRLGKPQIK
jgi:cytochrome c oxidase assembly protein subunit 15